MQSDIIYLDHAAATPIDKRVLADMLPYFSDNFYNPSSPYAPAVKVRHDYEDAKHRLAVCIGGKGDEIIITAGATESINIIFASATGHVVTLVTEHHAVLAAAALHQHTLVAVNNNGLVSPGEVGKAIRPDTTLVSVAFANNETGTIQPLREIAEVVKRERARRLEAGENTPIVFHSDASQGVGQIDVNVARLGVDAITINAGKIYGPKQVALLWASAGVKLLPIIVGGGQERAIRSGTENVAGTIGFARALELAVGHRNFESKRLAGLRDGLEAKLLQAFPSAVITGTTKKRLPGHLHISFPGVDAERLIFLLEDRGVLVATGSACAANNGTRSHVLTAMGVSPKVADGSLRLTLGRLIDDKIVDSAAAILIETITKEMHRSDNENI